MVRIRALTARAAPTVMATVAGVGRFFAKARFRADNTIIARKTSKTEFCHNFQIGRAGPRARVSDGKRDKNRSELTATRSPARPIG